MRLLTAITLLRDPEAKVTNVASQCGFNHLGLFSTCFRRRFNISPGEWRKISSETCQPPEQELVGSQAACRLQTIGLCPWCKGRDAQGKPLPGRQGGGKGRLEGKGALEFLPLGIHKQPEAQPRGS